MSNEIEYETKTSRDEVADHLERFATALRGDDSFSLTLGGKRVTLDPSRDVEFEVEVEDESSFLRKTRRSVTFELEWSKTDGDGKLP